MLLGRFAHRGVRCQHRRQGVANGGGKTSYICGCRSFDLYPSRSCRRGYSAATDLTAIEQSKRIQVVVVMLSHGYLQLTSPLPYRKRLASQTDTIDRAWRLCEVDPPTKMCNGFEKEVIASDDAHKSDDSHEPPAANSQPAVEDNGDGFSRSGKAPGKGADKRAGGAGGSHTTAIVAGAVGGVVGVAIIIAVVAAVLRSRRVAHTAVYTQVPTSTSVAVAEQQQGGDATDAEMLDPGMDQWSPEV